VAENGGAASNLCKRPEKVPDFFLNW